VVTRAATDVLATADQGVIRAVRFIRQHACGPIRTADVLQEARMSRARLEPRLKHTLGRTIHQEIQRVRLARVRELLAASTAPLKQIAQQVGFRYPEYMMRVFRQATGQTPGEYRKAARTTGGTS
jgi:LacI family transcriptional regulator